MTNTGAPANGASGCPDVGGDGNYVAYYSNASNVVPGDTDRAYDTFVYDTRTRHVTRVGVKPDGSQAEWPFPSDYADCPAIHADGRFVAFATNLVIAPDDTNQEADVYVHDRDADEDGIFDESDAIDTVRVA